MTIQELMNKRAKVWNDAKKWLDEKSNANGYMSAEDAKAYDRMEKEINDLGDQIERQKRAEQMESHFAQPVRDALKTGLHGGGQKTPRATDEYHNGFFQYMRVGNFGMNYDVRNALSVGTDTEGGYIAPEEYEKTLVSALDEGSIFRQFAHKIVTQGDRLIPLVQEHGTAQWIGEGASYTDSNEVFGQVHLSAHKLATMLKVSEELMADSAFDLADYIRREFVRRIGVAEESAFFTGDGTNKPTGVLNSAQVGVTAAAASAIKTDEVIDLYYSLRAPYRKKAVFIASDALIKQLRKLKDSNDQYLWQPALTAGASDMLLGNPIHASQHMPDVATGKKPLLFGKLSYYWIADRAGYSFKRLNERYADQGQVGFLASKRVDGKLLMPDAVKVLKMA